MGYAIYINEDAGSVTSALALGVSRPNQPGNLPPLVFGNKIEIDLYFITNGLIYNDFSGNLSGYTIEVALVSPGGSASRPSSGLFRLALDGSEQTSGILQSGKRYRINDYKSGDDFTNVGAASNGDGVYFVATGTTPTAWSNSSDLIEVTSDLDFNATIDEVEDALNGLYSISSAGNLDVIGNSGGPYTISFRDQGPRELIIGYAEDLNPKTTIYNSELTAGDASTREEQLLSLRRNVYAYNAAWTVIEDNSVAVGYRGTIDLNVDGTASLLAGGETADCYFEVLVSTATTRRTYALIPSTIRNNGISANTVAPTPLPTFLTQAQTEARFIQNKGEITGLTGGGASNLDGILTAGGVISLGTILAVEINSGIFDFYELISGTDAEGSPQIIRPDDYATTTNEVVWRRRTSRMSDTLETTNSSGDTTIAIPHGLSLYHVEIDFSGSAGTRKVILSTTNAKKGDTIILNYLLPATSGIVVETRNATSAGTELDPDKITTDTSGDNACGTCRFNGTEWEAINFNYPSL